jgi:hypothetical protein
LFDFVEFHQQKNIANKQISPFLLLTQKEKGYIIKTIFDIFTKREHFYGKFATR